MYRHRYIPVPLRDGSVLLSLIVFNSVTVQGIGTAKSALKPTLPFPLNTCIPVPGNGTKKAELYSLSLRIIKFVTGFYYNLFLF